jgi:hypothetical protein
MEQGRGAIMGWIEIYDPATNTLTTYGDKPKDHRNSLNGYGEDYKDSPYGDEIIIGKKGN